jgi:hypothetical protein
MEFRIADSFLDSLVRLTGDEQKAVKTTTFDIATFARHYQTGEPVSAALLQQ